MRKVSNVGSLRSIRGFLMLTAVSIWASGEARAAEEAAPATGEPAQAAPAQPTPQVATTPPVRAVGPAGAPRWREGFQLIPAIGFHSIQGDGGQGTGPGLRLGLMAGSRLAEILSLNVGFAFDMVNLDGPNASSYIFDIGFNPLFHFPLEKLEIVAGPLGGVFLNKAALGAGAATADIWAYGWTVGANAGLLFPVGSKVRIGGLLNFYLRNPMKSCVTANGMDTCSSENLNSQKVLGVSFAAIL